MKKLAALVLLASGFLAQAGAFEALDGAGAARLASPASHGKPTVVALWSSDCVHCKRNLQLFAALVNAHPRLQLITVAVEPAAQALAEPLDRMEVRGPRFAYGSQSPEALAYALDPKWRGELPRTLLFDGRGGKTALSGVLTEETVLRLLGLVDR